MSAACIGVFDSGVGGLSVLRALRCALPGAAFRYVADSGHGPYGERSDAFVIERSLYLAHHLLAHGAGLLVVACNTATAAAVEALRSALPDMPIVGVEPGVKPALAITRNGRIGVMATRGTLASERFARLLAEQQRTGVEFITQACPGLAQALEDGDADSAAVRALVERDAGALRDQQVDTVVLGCTHYPFAGAAIAAVLGGAVTLVDTAPAVAEQCARLAQDSGSGSVQLQTTGDPQRLQQIATRWLDFDFAMLPRID